MTHVLVVFSLVIKVIIMYPKKHKVVEKVETGHHHHHGHRVKCSCDGNKVQILVNELKHLREVGEK